MAEVSDAAEVEAAASSAWSRYVLGNFRPGPVGVADEIKAFDAGFAAGLAEGSRQSRQEADRG